MKRVAYENFGKDAKKVTVMSTEYKTRGDGKVVWIDEENNVYVLNYARRAKVWAALKTGWTLDGLIKENLVK